MNATKSSQEAELLAYLSRGRSITAAEAFTLFGITCLARRLSDCRKHGYKFKKLPVHKMNRHGWLTRFFRYSLEKVK